MENIPTNRPAGGSESMSDGGKGGMTRPEPGVGYEEVDIWDEEEGTEQ
jgi:hypothetical protein